MSAMETAITSAFKQELKQLTWLDDFSRQASVEKVDTIVSQIAYPDEIFNNSYLNDIYANVWLVVYK